MKVLGLDFGTKYIGLSISDKDQKLAFPRGKIENQKAISFIKKMAIEEEAQLIVLGKPTNMKGQPTQMSAQVETFKQNLEKETGLEVIYQDERLSSKQVDKSLQFLEINTRKRKEIKDTLEAVTILQQYLDTIKK